MSMEKVVELVVESFVFPLVLIGAGAFFSNRLIPSITQKWQNHQKSLEIKTDIIQELIQLVMTILVNGDDYHRAKEEDKENLKKLNMKKEKKWLIKKCVIGSKLHAYFPDNKYGKKELHAYFSDVLASNFINYSLGKELMIDPNEHPRENLNTWEGKRKYLLDKKADFIKKILEIDTKDIAFLQVKKVHAEPKQVNRV